MLRDDLIWHTVEGVQVPCDGPRKERAKSRRGIDSALVADLISRILILRDGLSRHRLASSYSLRRLPAVLATGLEQPRRIRTRCERLLNEWT
jgi:hypothetical protein